MEITRRSDYAIRMLLALAAAGEACPVSVRELADRQGVPYAFARAVQRDLSAAGLVTATRGASGGLCLAKRADQITLLDAVTATQGEPTVAVCANNPGWCDRSEACSVHRVWCDVDELVKEHLGTKTLAGLIGGDRK